MLSAGYLSPIGASFYSPTFVYPSFSYGGYSPLDSFSLGYSSFPFLSGGGWSYGGYFNSYARDVMSAVSIVGGWGDSWLAGDPFYQASLAFGYPQSWNPWGWPFLAPYFWGAPTGGGSSPSRSAAPAAAQPAGATAPQSSGPSAEDIEKYVGDRVKTGDDATNKRLDAVVDYLEKGGGGGGSGGGGRKITIPGAGDVAAPPKDTKPLEGAEKAKLKTALNILNGSDPAWKETSSTNVAKPHPGDIRAYKQKGFIEYALTKDNFVHKRVNGGAWQKLGHISQGI